MSEHTPDRLSPARLGDLPSSAVVPGYSRDEISAGIAHIGVGGFHRAHQALYLDDLFHRQSGPWGVCGVGLLPQDSRMAEALLPQSGLYTLVERGEGAQPPRVIGSLLDYLHAPADPEAVLARLADPAIRIVSLTITEGGYYQDQGSGELERDAPALRHDLDEPDEPPRSVYGYLAGALARRRDAGIAPFTVLSCDNLQHNGNVIRRMLCAFARLRDPMLADWIESEVAFPNSMVDRITPATTDQDRAEVGRMLGMIDAWPVVSEPFRQWVIEDRFCNGRPELEAVGVQMTDDVDPYELMKIRLLNASHQALGYLGVLAGHKYVDDAMRDPLFHALVTRYMERVRPLISEPPGIDLEEYQRTLLVRFANPAIKDTLARLCFDGSARIPKFVLPSLREQLAKGGPVDLFALIVAGWCRYLAGRDEAGRTIPIEDALAETMQARVRFGYSDPRPFLGLRQLFGEDLAQSEAFVDAVRAALESLYRKGARATLAEYLEL